jgi:hypothetical protein
MAEEKNRIEVRPTRITNHKDVDVVVRDFYGREHVLFPMTEKELPMVSTKGKKDDRCRTGC